jgi:hypothetical protein
VLVLAPLSGVAQNTSSAKRVRRLVRMLCGDHAPIPYTLTPLGHKEAREMLLWSAIHETLGYLATASRGQAHALSENSP